MNRKASNGSSRRRPSPARVPVTVRLPEEVVQQINDELGGREIPLSRNNWFLEAAIEKLRRSKSGGALGTK